MLMITRKKGQVVWIGKDIVVTIIQPGPGQVRVGIEAPKDVPVTRPDMKTLDRKNEDG